MASLLIMKRFFSRFAFFAAILASLAFLVPFAGQAQTPAGVTRHCSFACQHGTETVQPSFPAGGPPVCTVDSECAASCETACAALGDGSTCATSPAPSCAAPVTTPSAAERRGGRYGLNNPLGTVNIPTILGRFVKAAIGLVGALFLVMFIFGGFLWMTAGGSEDRIKKARKTLVNATLGFIVVALSYTFVTIVFQYIGALAG